jgi:hypothetical protein
VAVTTLPNRVPRLPRPTWWQAFKAGTAIRSRGPWPATSLTPIHNPHVVDVDRYEDNAAVLWFYSRDGFTPASTDLFRRHRLRWINLGGGRNGGGAQLLTLRQRHVFRDGQKLQVVASGGTDDVLSAEILCSPDVAIVEVRRKAGTRTARVEDGPGLIVVSWRDGEQPKVVAFDATGQEIFSLAPKHRNPRRPWRRDEGIGDGSA